MKGAIYERKIKKKNRLPPLETDIKKSVLIDWRFSESLILCFRWWWKVGPDWKYPEKRFDFVGYCTKKAVRFELISGHRRKRACDLLGHGKTAGRIVEPSNDEAVIMMADSNCQRTKVLPSERTFAYKMKLEAMKDRESVLI